MPPSHYKSKRGQPTQPVIPSSLLTERHDHSTTNPIIHQQQQQRSSPYSRPSQILSRKQARKQQRGDKKQRKHSFFSHSHPSTSVSLSTTTTTTMSSKSHPSPSSSNTPSMKKIVDKPKVKRTDHENMLKVAKKDPVLMAKLSSSGIIPVDLSQDRNRAEIIDCMDIDRYERLLHINKSRKRKNNNNNSTELSDDINELDNVDNLPVKVPLGIARDGLSDLFATVYGVTSSGLVKIRSDPIFENDTTNTTDEDDDDEGEDVISNWDEEDLDDD